MNKDSPPSRTDSVTIIVAEALELEGDALHAFLDRTCGEDRELREEVEGLLGVANSGRAEGFLETPAVEAMLGNATQEAEPPRQVGDFELLRPLGKGGMGAVYLAEQHEPVRRRVALKLLRGPRNARVRRRFVREWQALARLNHPNVAGLYEVGEGPDESWPYVAMEWVDGPPITRRCDEDRLSVDQRLRIFREVCDGVSHAHEKGILHCDLKPSNILLGQVDGRHVAKVIDFGIARGTDAPLNEDGEASGEILMGSPPYISPEAAVVGNRHQLDARTDVYALGLVLYELLTGSLPFDHDGLNLFAALRLISESDPVGPKERFEGLELAAQRQAASNRSTTVRRLRRRLRGDLEAIVMKATARDPRHRYGSPAELAADVSRHLARRPIEARRHTPFYVVRRLARRHAVIATATGVVVLSLAAGLVARTMEANRANRALAESEQIRTFLLELFEQADPEQAAGSALTVEDLLRQGRERLQTDLSDLPGVRAELLQVIGTVSTKLDQLVAAEEAIRESVEIRRQLLPAGDPDLLNSQNELGVVLRRLGRLDEAEVVLAAVLESRLNERNVDLESLARAHSNLGNVHFSQARYEEAVARHREALRLRERLREENDTSETRNNVAISANNLGAILRLQDKPVEARAPLQQAVEVFREENPALLGSALNNLGSVERIQRTWRRAEAVFREAIDVQEATLGASHSRALQSRRNLILTLTDQHRFAEALQEAQVALELAAGSEDAISKAQVLHTVGLAEIKGGDTALAILRLEECVDLVSQARGMSHPVAQRCSAYLAEARALSGDEEGALVEIGDLLTVELEALPRSALLALVRALIELGRFDQAEPLALRYRDGLTTSNGEWGLRELGQIRRGQGDLERARLLFEQAWEGLEKRYGPDHALVVEARKALEVLPTPSA